MDSNRHRLRQRAPVQQEHLKNAPIVKHVKLNIQEFEGQEEYLEIFWFIKNTSQAKDLNNTNLFKWRCNAMLESDWLLCWTILWHMLCMYLTIDLHNSPYMTMWEFFTHWLKHLQWVVAFQMTINQQICKQLVTAAWQYYCMFSGCRSTTICSLCVCMIQIYIWFSLSWLLHSSAN